MLAALLAAGLLVPGAVPAAAVTPAEAPAKARETLADPRFQRTLPDHPAESDPEETERTDRNRSPRASGGAEEVVLPVLGAGALLARLIFLVLLAVVALLVAVWIVSEIGRRRRRSAGAESGVVEEISREPAAARELQLDDASRLAAEGRYAEAVHALLLAAIRHYAERSRVAVQPSRTSRELVRLLPLGPETREAFAELVRTVELSLFGGAPVGAEDYERNLARFQTLTRRPA